MADTLYTGSFAKYELLTWYPIHIEMSKNINEN